MSKRAAMKSLLPRFLTPLCLAMALALPGWASDLDAAKAAGAVGEQPNGYLAAVREPAPADVRALIETINAERRRQYQSIAARNNITLQQVELLAGKKAVERTASGHWVRLPDGSWTPK